MTAKPTTVTITFAPGEIPAGFRLTGEYREPKIGEWYLHGGGSALQVYEDYGYSHLILQKLPQKKRRGKGKK